MCMFPPPHLLLDVVQAPPPVRAVPGDEGQVLGREGHGPEQQQGGAVAPGPVHHQHPAPLHPQHGQGPGPARHREASVQQHVPRDLAPAGRPPHHPAQELQQQQDGDGHLEAKEAGARDVLGLHVGAVLLVEDAVDGAQEEGDGEEDGGHQGEVEAGRDALVHPGVGDGGVGLAVALEERHGRGCGEGERRFKRRYNYNHFRSICAGAAMTQEVGEPQAAAGAVSSV